MEEIKKMDASFVNEALDLVSYAFSWELSERNIKRYQWLAKYSWNYGSFDNQGRLASQVMATPFSVNLFGKAYQMAGIGFVASYPEYRSQGRIDRIMQQILNDCNENNILLTYLAPFSYPFYRRYGYELTFERAVYDVPADKWPDSPKTTGFVERQKWTEAKEQVTAIYNSCKKHQKGALIRDEWWLEYKFSMSKDYTFAVYYNEARQAEGYLVYLISEGTLKIAEWNYLSGAAFQGLNRFIASHNGSVSKIVYEHGYDGQNLQFLTTTPLENYRVRPEMMARVVNSEAFLRQYLTDCNLETAFAIEIKEDRYASWNNGIYELSTDEGQIKIKKAATTKLPKVILTIQRFTQLFMGYKTTEELAFHQLIKGEEVALIALEKLLSRQKPILEDYF